MIHCLTIVFKKELYDCLCGQLYDLGMNSFQEIEKSSKGDGFSEIIIYSNTRTPLDNVYQNITNQGNDISMTFTESEDDYLNAWKEHAKPILISNSSVILPSWATSNDFDSSSYNCILRIDPGYAFGSGSHETTILCLRELEKLELENKSVLDVGSGSGILSIFAAINGATKVLGIDIDPEAQTSAIENAKNNHVDDKVTFSNMPLEKVGQTFDIVVANILSSVILSFGETLKNRVRPGGILLLSGILDDEVAMVTANLQLSNCEISHLEDWASIKYCKHD